ncbi:MAG: hypothetical protein IJG38_01465 [Thermoguttaceae bacterium]|nr:hypothetical protein [Thermoguttaceae bacterium]
MEGGNGASNGRGITHRRAERPSTKQKNQRQRLAKPKTLPDRGILFAVPANA